MPGWIKIFKGSEREKNIKRNNERRINYEKGRFGRVNKYTKWQQFIVLHHMIFSDRFCAKIFGSSTNAIQALRWRIKNNYLGLYS